MERRVPKGSVIERDLLISRRGAELVTWLVPIRGE